jgi:glycosyltransferase involved in cell wall biosynthesis
MSEHFSVSVIVPFYNAEPYLKRCIDVLSEQDFNKPFEVIMVDDASTDNSQNIIKVQNSPLLKLRSLPSNTGPSAARNIGLKVAKGEYVFFLDADDTISTCTLKTLYSHAKENDFDLVYSDQAKIEKSQNQSENIFIHPADKIYSKSDITEEIIKRIYDPLFIEGLVGITGRLIKRSIITQNNLSFEERLRYLEDEAFAWDILAHCKKAKYIRKQLYSYYVQPNVSSAVSDGFNRGFSVSNFKLVKGHIQNCFKHRGLSTQETEKLADQAYIYFIIGALVSYSRSIILGKVDLEIGKNCRTKLIEDVLKEPDVSKAIKTYSRSENENQWIPRAIAWKFRNLLEFACNNRAKEILRIRRKGSQSSK